MKKKIYKLTGIVLAAAFMCGCVPEVPDLSEEEAELITEYATNLIVKHSEISDRNLLSETDFQIGALEEERLLQRKEKEEEIVQQMLKGETESVEDDDDGESSANKENSPSDQVTVPSETISEFYGEDNFSIEYTSYELTDSYPKEGTKELFIAMDATEGHQFCALKFAVTNLTAEEQDFNMFSKQARFILETSDGSVVQAQTTMLLDDLCFYKGVVAPGVSQELVLLFEVSDQLTQMDSMKLIMKSAGDTNTILLN